MLKYIVIIAAFATLSACKPDTREKAVSEVGRVYMVECIDGVEYWKERRGHAGFMSPRINPETLDFVRCGEK